MTTRLKSLELYGYKTFATKTLFKFSDRITSIIGPNGSGKSNIADSLRWVLGEQSYRLLRGKKTEDMIFSGSELRPRLGMASATITFDNSDGWLPIDFTEVAITRRAYRDGQNEYLINGQRVRLRDVSELLAESGLAERTYTIIGQGLVDTALSLKAEERRKLFEEAAGIGLHRSRREEALRRFEKTQRNLERVQDILSELKPRLRSLERQAKRAKDHDRVKQDLKEILREWYGYHWYKMQDEIVQAQKIAEEREKALSEIRQEQQKLEEQANGLFETIKELRQTITSKHRELSDLHAQKEEVSRNYAVASERIRSIREQIANTEKELSDLVEERKSKEIGLKTILSEIENQEQELNEARRLVEAAKVKLEEMLSKKQSLELELQKSQDDLLAVKRKLDKLNMQVVAKENQLENIKKHINRSIEQLSALNKEKDENDEKYQITASKYDEIERRYKRQLEETTLIKDKLHQTKAKRNEIDEEVSNLITKKSRLVSELDVLTQAERSLTGYREGTKTIMDAFRKGNLKGVLGILIRNLTVEPSYELAISAALGEYIDAVIIRDEPDNALNLLKKNSQRGVLIPIRKLKANRGKEEQLTQKNVLGYAIDFVKVSPELINVAALLLGDTVIVKDRTAAKQFVSSQNRKLRAVTLDGEVYYAGGQIYYHGVWKNDQEKELLYRQRRIKEIEEELKKIRREISKLEHNKEKIETEIAELEERLIHENSISEELRAEKESLISEIRQHEVNGEKIGHEIEWVKKEKDRLTHEIDILQEEIARLKKAIESEKKSIPKLESNIKENQSKVYAFSIDALKADVTHWDINIAVLERSFRAINERKSERLSNLEQIKQLEGILNERIESYSKTLYDLQVSMDDAHSQESKIAEKIDEIQQSLGPSENELLKTEDSYNTLQKELSQLRKKVTVYEQNYSKARIALAKVKEKINALQSQIENDFGLVAFEYAEPVDGPSPLPLTGLVEQLPRITEISPDLEVLMKQLKVQMRRMGAINPEAEAEYKEVKERYEFLLAQVEDLNKAEEDIHKVINELDDLMAEEFLKTFEAVEKEFGEIFRRLFGGGSAELILSDRDDVMNAGIEINAKLPGRRTQGLSLLSGGERSLTAMALIFALLKVSPTPFCLMDEVDAMLDEANAGRFRDLLWEKIPNLLLLHIIGTQFRRQMSFMV